MTLLLALRTLYTESYFTDRGTPQARPWTQCLATLWSFRLALLPVLRQVRDDLQHRSPHIPARRIPQQWVEHVRWTTAAASLAMASDYLDAASLQAFSWAAPTVQQALHMALSSRGFIRSLARGW